MSIIVQQADDEERQKVESIEDEKDHRKDSPRVVVNVTLLIDDDLGRLEAHPPSRGGRPKALTGDALSIGCRARTESYTGGHLSGAAHVVVANRGVLNERAKDEQEGGKEVDVQGGQMANLGQLSVCIGNEGRHGEDGRHAEGNACVRISIQPEGNKGDDGDEEGGQVDSGEVKVDVPRHDELQP